MLDRINWIIMHVLFTVFLWAVMDFGGIILAIIIWLLFMIVSIYLSGALDESKDQKR